MRRAVPARDQAQAVARPATGSPATDSAEPAPIRRAVGLSGLAVGSPAVGSLAVGSLGVGSLAVGPSPLAGGSSGAGPAANHVPAQQGADLGALRRQAAQHGGPTIRRMSVGGAPTASSVSGTTSAKHVMAEPGQAADAAAGYGSRTYVTSEAVLTAAVDADAHNFAAGPARSARVDVNASVPIYQYDKTNAPPAGLAAGQPVARSVNGVATNCEIGAVKTGAGEISITHFKKVNP